jgi:DNA topoisomerase-2
MPPKKPKTRPADGLAIVTSKSDNDQKLSTDQQVNDDKPNDPSTPKSKKTKKEIDLTKLLEEDSKKYTKKELKQHILDLPSTYIGSVVPGEIETWVWQGSSDANETLVEDSKSVASGREKTQPSTSVPSTPIPMTSVPSTPVPSTPIPMTSVPSTPVPSTPKPNTSNEFKPSFVLKKITVALGLYKIIDEILQNAADNVPRTRLAHATDPEVELTTQLKIWLGDDGEITIQNNGEGIPIVEHAEHKILIPTMIFGELLTSGNYDKTQERRWGGMNGYGGKVTSIFSKYFILETVDRVRQKKFVQKWTDNMSNVGPAKVTSFSNKPYTKITFLPDYKRFGCDNISRDLRSLLVRRVYDLAGITGASVFLNGKKLAVKHFQHYTEMYLEKSIKRTYECVYDKKDSSTVAWEIVACPSPDGVFRHVSYVNFVSTFQGGHHVDWVSAKISKKLTDMVNEKLTKAQTPIQPKHVKNNLWVFVNASIINPLFSSQTKEFLSSSVSALPPCDLSDAFFTKLLKTEIIERAKLLKDFHEQKLISKTDGRKVKSITGIPKLEDANEAGGKKSKKCTLIICEGDSARTFAIAGLGVVGRDFYGVYPLKGKVMNIRDATPKEISENKEINELKKILGLREGIKSIDELRYGELMILTDEDVDGIHIKALVMNLFDVFWKDVMKAGFIVSMYTPLVKIRRKDKVIASFFNERDFETWRQSHELTSGFDVRYYKGLGTHDANEARECFKTMQKIKYKYDENADKMLQMGFDKKFSDQRKVWIAKHHHKQLDYTAKELPISEFIDKGLILFSNADNIRSIPSFMDGFKPSQRKVVCGFLRRNQVKPIKVSQIVGPISSDMAYHHGENSLVGTIINMAQNFVGSNNINLLNPSGQFGTRLKGGNDAASARYILTSMEPVMRKIFVKEDDALLSYRTEDGKMVDPDFYLPIIPMILVNGSSGIGTGFSTNVPNHNPLEIIQCIRNLLNNQPLATLHLLPWYRKFKGDIVREKTQIISKGKYTQTNKTVHITELPLGTWTDTYKAYLDTITVGRQSSESDDGKKRKRQKQLCVLGYKFGKRHDEQNVDLMVEMDKTYSDVELQQLLKLSETKTCSDSNMHVFDPYGHLARFNSSMDILRTFVTYRLKFYKLRRRYQLELMEREMIALQEKIRFIQEIVDKTLPILDKSKKDVCDLLMSHKYKANPHQVPIRIQSLHVNDWIEASDPYIVKTDLYSRDYSSIKSVSLITSDSETMEESEDRHTDDRQAEDQTEPLLSQYKYLMSISVFNMTREEIVKLKNEYASKKKHYDDLQSMTPEKMWINELDELEKEIKRSQLG